MLVMKYSKNKGDLTKLMYGRLYIHIYIYIIDMPKVN